MDFYIDIILQIISLIAYSTIIIRTTWFFVPNRFPKLPADKKWPNYLITSLYALIIVLLLTTFGFYYLDDSKDFGDEFRKMDRVIEETELHINNTIGALPEIGDPEVQLDGLSEEIIEQIKNDIGLSAVENKTEEFQFMRLDFFQTFREISVWHHQLSKVCESVVTEKDSEIVIASVLFSGFIGEDTRDHLPTVKAKINSPKQNLSNIITNKKIEFENEKKRLINYLKPAKIFFEKIAILLKKSRKMFNKRKEESIQIENSKNVVIFIPFSFAIFFAFVSIVTNIIWGKYIPRTPSIILCILFYILSIQVIIISTYIAYNIPDDIFIQEPEYFKLFDFEMSSYDNKSVANAHETFLNCDHEKSTIISALDNGFFISDYPLLNSFHDQLLETLDHNLNGITNFKQTNIKKAKSEVVEPIIRKLIRVQRCNDSIREQNEKHIDFVNKTDIYLQLFMELARNIENINYFTGAVVQEKIKDINRTIYEPIFKINQSLIEADFKCQPLYNAQLNGFISSHQPDKNVYRDIFKVTVMGCSTLCLILYLLAVGRRMNQTTCDSRYPKKNMDSDKNREKPEGCSTKKPETLLI